jgi:hypothetical protein
MSSAAAQGPPAHIMDLAIDWLPTASLLFMLNRKSANIVYKYCFQSACFLGFWFLISIVKFCYIIILVLLSPPHSNSSFFFFFLGKCCHFWATHKFVVTLLLFGEIFEKIVINKCYIYFGMFIAYLPYFKKKLKKL